MAQPAQEHFELSVAERLVMKLLPGAGAADDQ